jgi:hypothetical protein
MRYVQFLILLVHERVGKFAQKYFTLDSKLVSKSGELNESEGDEEVEIMEICHKHTSVFLYSTVSNEYIKKGGNFFSSLYEHSLSLARFPGASFHKTVIKVT